MGAAERATGKTTAQILEMMKSGKLMSKEFIMPFIKAMRGMVRENDALKKATEKLSAQQNRVNTAFKKMVDLMFKDGVSEAMRTLFKDMADGVEYLTPAVVAASSAISGTFKVVWDFGTAAISLLGDVVGALADVGKAMIGLDRNKSGKFLMFLDGVLESTLATIYEIIAGMYKIGDILSMDNKVATLARAAGADTVANWLDRGNTTNTIGGASQSSKSVSIGKIEVNSSKADAGDVADELMQRIGIEMVGFQ